jgi:hypothetical protein
VLPSGPKKESTSKRLSSPWMVRAGTDAGLPLRSTARTVTVCRRPSRVAPTAVVTTVLAAVARSQPLNRPGSCFAKSALSTTDALPAAGTVTVARSVVKPAGADRARVTGVLPAFV